MRHHSRSIARPARRDALSVAQPATQPATLPAALPAALLLVALGAAVALADEPVTETHPFEPGSTLEIECEDGGSAFIRGWDEPQIKVTYFDDRDDLDDYAIRIRERRGGLEIAAGLVDRHRRSTSLVFEISVPREVDVRFRSAGGSLSVEGVRGDIEGTSGGGSLSLVDVTGEAELTTGGGSIEIIECRLDGRVTTGGGEVLVRDVVGNVEATSGGGEVRYLNVRGQDGQLRAPGGLRSRETREMEEETVVIRSAGGGIDVDHAPAGAIVATGGGDIRIDDASRFVEAMTGGGNIDILVVDGSVSARTGAGDIRVEVLRGLGEHGPDGIDLVTGLGDVTVILPRGLSLDIDVEIGYTRSSRRDYEILSDFDLEVRHTRDWSYDQGSPRKTIRGRAVLGDGTHRVRIRTVNGTIRLRVED